MCSYHIKNVGYGYNFIPFHSILDDQEAIFSLFHPLIILQVLQREQIKTRNYTYDYKNLHFITTALSPSLSLCHNSITGLQNQAFKN